MDQQGQLSITGRFHVEIRQTIRIRGKILGGFPQLGSQGHTRAAFSIFLRLVKIDDVNEIEEST